MERVFPHGHVLNALSSAIFTGFKKEFKKEDGRYVGITSDTDNRIHARNSLEVINVGHEGGSIEPGQYVLLRYLDFPWQGYYDIFKVVNDNLLIGRVYLGEYPNGVRLFTFPMTREYGFDQMTVDDHAELFASGSVPTPAEVDGAWRMDVISNANQLGAIAYLQFSSKPDGNFEARYQLLGLMEGLVVPSFLKDHFQLNDFTPFHDEIRKVNEDYLVGKYVTELPAAVASLVGNSSLGVVHSEAGGKFGFYYTLTRASAADLPDNTLLRPFLDVQLPDGIGLTFDEGMVGWYFPGQGTPAPGREGDLTLAGRIPASGTPAGAVTCGFDGHIGVRDVNEFIDGYEHEAPIKGTIEFGQFENQSSATFVIDEVNSRFHYLRINPTSREAELRYHLEFQSADRRKFTFEGVKYTQKDGTGLFPSIRDILGDYTTLFCHVYENLADGSARETGTAYLKFRTFEDLAAVGSLAGFLASFQISGTNDPVTQFQARLRFLAFTAQFLQREYDPLGLPAAQFADDIHAEVFRGAATRIISAPARPRNCRRYSRTLRRRTWKSW